MSVDEAIAPTDAICQRYLESLQNEFGAKILGTDVTKTDLTIRVERSEWVAVAKAAKKLGLTYFSFLSGLDWLDNPTQTTRYENIWGSVEEEGEPSDDAPAGEPTEAAGPKTGKAGGDSRFQVFMRLWSPTEHRGLTVKADLSDDDPRIPTISKVFAGADWHEREAWEMYGFWFEGHPNLVHIYLPGAFEGYPLRKDFPLLAREVKPWPGLTNVEPIAGEGDEEESA